jgi:hypothetical protein
VLPAVAYFDGEYQYIYVDLEGDNNIGGYQLDNEGERTY